MVTEGQNLGRLVGWARFCHPARDRPRRFARSPYLAILIAMRRTVSIAQAKNDLLVLVHAAEDHPVVIERRGKRVAVLLSARAYDQLTGAGGDLWSAIRRFRKTHDVDSLDLGGVFENVRNRSLGREFEW